MPDIKVSLRQQGRGTTIEGALRNHKVTIDRTEAKGGTDRGPMGGELLLAGLGGCFLSNVIEALNARDLPAENLQMEVVGALEGAPPRFERMAVAVSAEGLSKEALAKILVVAERSCIVANTLKGDIALEFKAV
jgi:putative redox protein